ncbi:MAG: ATP-dependent Clp protease adapter ClpS [Oligoflexia bacterium]|nr:ATP-dependent Clp protease adapter ClpS [Oligoflexia bacterium]
MSRSNPSAEAGKRSEDPRSANAPSEEGGVAVQEGRPELKEPPRYAVLLHNDDYTTMEFVVEVLERFFKKTAAEAVEVMLRVHQQGQGVAGIYTRDIAETKAAQVIEYARGRGYPLLCTAKPAV